MLLGLIPKAKMSIVNNVFGHRSILQVALLYGQMTL